MIQIAADFAKLYTSFMEQKGLETDLTGIWAKLDLIL